MKKIFLLFFILLYICVFPKACLVRGESVSDPASQIKVLFSPQDNCAQEVISVINNAQKYVYVAMYYFTSRPIAQAIANASARGVDVKVCMDGSEPHYEHSKEEYLENKNIPVKLITGKGIMHNKFCVIDDEVVITGSFNWTARADLENDENVLIVHSGKITGEYKAEFERLWGGKKIDAYQYTEESRAEKAPLAGAIAATPFLKTQSSVYTGHKVSKKFHRPGCKWAGKIKPENKIEFSSRQEAIDKGYISCKTCKPR